MTKKVDRLLSVKEAAKILNVKENNVSKVMKVYDHQVGRKGTHLKNYYKESRVRELAAKREEQKKSKTQQQAHYGGRHFRRERCECGRWYTIRKGRNKCRVCTEGFDKWDPYGTMIKVEKQNRKCPKCGGDLWDEEYLCRACTAKRGPRPDLELDAEEAYGSFTFTG